MTESWEEVSWEYDTTDKEWIVEYEAKRDGVVSTHLSLLISDSIENVHKSLLEELKTLYPGTSPVEVTVLSVKRADEVDDDFGEHSLFME